MKYFLILVFFLVSTYSFAQRGTNIALMTPIKISQINFQSSQPDNTMTLSPIGSGDNNIRICHGPGNSYYVDGVKVKLTDRNEVFSFSPPSTKTFTYEQIHSMPNGIESIVELYTTRY